MRYNFKNRTRRSIIKQYLFRVRYRRVAFNRIFFQLVSNNNYISNQSKAVAAFQLSQFPVYSSIGKQKNICLRTGRMRSVNNFTGLSRLEMREQAYNLHLPGITAAK